MIYNKGCSPIARAITGKRFGTTSSSASSFVTVKGGVAAEGRSQTRPRAVVLVLGFGGAKSSHMEKYARLYNRKGCSTVSGTASNRSLFVDPAGVDSFAREAVREVANLLREDESPPPPAERATPVVMHIMSNGGAFVVRRIGEMLAAPIDSCAPDARCDLELFGARLRAGCQIFDSAPCYLDGKSCFNVMRNLIPNPIVGIPMATLFTLRMYVLNAMSRMMGKPTFGETFWNALIEDTTCGMQAFLYSCKDDVAHSTKIEEFVTERSRRGVNVMAQHFYDSSHVQHLRLHGKEYSDFIENVLIEMEEGGNKKMS
ncbi:hypothetical protein ACHAW5_003440 [Stephanodiscus triporus]|uniref:Uncharacterized protein n=1 Tax=Stephanodiscus triporus TaxID=2934178 RepID=A0ABD3NBA1_9STRA